MRAARLVEPPHHLTVLAVGGLKTGTCGCSWTAVAAPDHEAISRQYIAHLFASALVAGSSPQAVSCIGVSRRRLVEESTRTAGRPSPSHRTLARSSPS